MIQTELFPDAKKQTVPNRFPVGRTYVLHPPRGARRKGYVYYQGGLLKKVDLYERGQRQLLVVELMQQGVNQTRVAAALRLSRQTLHNYRES